MTLLEDFLTGYVTAAGAVLGVTTTVLLLFLFSIVAIKIVNARQRRQIKKALDRARDVALAKQALMAKVREDLKQEVAAKEVKPS